MTTLASLASIRAAFPALRRTQDDMPVAYFDSPGGTQVPQVVLDAMRHYLANRNANTHWNYASSRETDAMLLEARATFAAFVGGAPDEISFGNNMTTITMHLARTLARQWTAGDEVIVTELDHHANVAPWHALAAEHGIRLRWIPFDRTTMRLDLDLLPSLLSKRTRLLAIGAASNVIGTVTNVARATTLVHEAGALVFVDAVHLAPHLPIDVIALGADMLACSAYKFYGPHVGILWTRRDLREQLDPPRVAAAPSDGPEKLETGTQNHEGIAGAAAAVRWLGDLSGGSADLRTRLGAALSGLHARQGELFDALWRGLGDIEGVTRFGIPPTGASRTPTVAFALRGIRADVAADRLSARGCFVSHGDFYASTAVERLGVGSDGVLRAGLACYSTADEVARLVKAVAEVATRQVG